VVREGQETVADFRLQRSPIELNPIVAIGYGTALKHDLTGAVSSVTADQFETKAAPTITLSSGLQGKAAGVQVTSNTGLPGGGLRVRVRGTGSITANSEPLYVIDGLPAEQGTSSSDPKAHPLMAIDAHEIEAINVLKDASATAIYGARGANGVVRITTRRRQGGGSRVTLGAAAGRRRWRTARSATAPTASRRRWSSRRSRPPGTQPARGSRPRRAPSRCPTRSLTPPT